jgi:transcriptional regulator GlxA family with amidase domain
MPIPAARNARDNAGIKCAARMSSDASGNVCCPSRKISPARAAAGAFSPLSFARNAMLLPWLRKTAAQGAHIAGFCTGVVYLAEAGLLDRRQATTHWAVADQFRQRYPKVD